MAQQKLKQQDKPKTLHLNTIKTPDEEKESEIVVAAPVEEHIEVKGFDQTEESRDAKYIAEDFKAKSNNYGMWEFKGKKGGSIPKGLKGTFTDMRSANAVLVAFINRQG